MGPLNDLNRRPDEIDELLTLSLSGDFDAAESVLAHLIHERGIAPNAADQPVLPCAGETGRWTGD